MSGANICISSKIKSDQKPTQKLEATQLRCSKNFQVTEIAQNPENSNANNYCYSKGNKNIWASNYENALNNEDKEPHYKTKQIEELYNNDENSMIQRIVQNLNNIMDQSEKGDSNHFSKENSESKRSYSMERQYYSSQNRDNNINLINSIGNIGYSNTHLKKYNEIALLGVFNSLYPKKKLLKRSSSMNNSQLHSIYKLSKNKNSINIMKNNKQSNYKSSFCSGNDIQIKKQEEFCYSPDRKINIKYQKSNNLHLTSTINSSNNRNGENKTNGTTQASTYNNGTLSSNNNNANSNTSNTCNTGNTLSSLINMTPTLYSKSNLKNYLTSSNYKNNNTNINNNNNIKATNNKNKAKLSIPTFNKTSVNQVIEKNIKDNNHSSSNKNQNNSNSNKLSNPNSFPQDKKQTAGNNDNNLNLFSHNKYNLNSTIIPTITNNTDINDNKANNLRANLEEPIKENDFHQFSNENSSSIKATIELKSKNINSLSKKESHKSIINKDFSNINISSIKSTNSSNVQNNKDHYSKSEECTKSKRSRSYDIIFTKLSKNYIESRLNSDCYSKENNNCTLSDNIAFQKRREIGKKQVILFSINSEENKLPNGINKLMKVTSTDINDANANNNKLNSNFLEIIDNQMNTQVYGSTLWQDAVIRANKEARDESIPSDIYSDSKFFNSSSSNNNLTNSLEQDTYYLNKTMKKTKKKSKENNPQTTKKSYLKRYTYMTKSNRSNSIQMLPNKKIYSDIFNTSFKEKDLKHYSYCEFKSLNAKTLELKAFTLAKIKQLNQQHVNTKTYQESFYEIYYNIHTDTISKMKYNTKNQNKREVKQQTNNSNNNNNVNVIKTNCGNKKINEKENAFSSNEDKSPPDDNSNSSGVNISDKNQNKAREYKLQLTSIFSLIPKKNIAEASQESSLADNYDNYFRDRNERSKEKTNHVVRMKQNNNFSIIPDKATNIDSHQNNDITRKGKEENMNNNNMNNNKEIDKNDEIDLEFYYKSKSKLSKKKISELVGSVSVIDERFYKEFLQGSLVILVSMQNGSFALQSSIKKFSQEALNHVVEEIAPCFLSLTKNAYANYFCQLIFVHFSDELKMNVIKEILSNFKVISKNTISFKTVSFLLENKLPKECEELISNYFINLKKSNYYDNKVLRVFESMVSFQPKCFEFILDFICSDLVNIVKIRQGFFLIRKLIKKIKDESIQLRLINTISRNIAQFVSSVNGCLLAQCIIRNYCYDIKDENISDNAYNNQNYNNNNANKNSDKNSNDVIESTTTNSNNNNSKSNSNPSNLSLISFMQGANKHLYVLNYSNKALVLFFDDMLSELLIPSMNKYYEKIFKCAVKYGGGVFINKMLQKLTKEYIVTNTNTENAISIENIQSDIIIHEFDVLIKLMQTERGSKVVQYVGQYLNLTRRIELYKLLVKITHLTVLSKKSLNDWEAYLEVMEISIQNKKSYFSYLNNDNQQPNNKKVADKGEENISNQVNSNIDNEQLKKLPDIIVDKKKLIYNNINNNNNSNNTGILLSLKEINNRNLNNNINNIDFNIKNNTSKNINRKNSNNSININNNYSNNFSNYNENVVNNNMFDIFNNKDNYNRREVNIDSIGNNCDQNFNLNSNVNDSKNMHNYLLKLDNIQKEINSLNTIGNSNIMSNNANNFIKMSNNSNFNKIIMKNNYNNDSNKIHNQMHNQIDSLSNQLKGLNSNSESLNNNNQGNYWRKDINNNSDSNNNINNNMNNNFNNMNTTLENMQTLQMMAKNLQNMINHQQKNLNDLNVQNMNILSEMNSKSQYNNNNSNNNNYNNNNNRNSNYNNNSNNNNNTNNNYYNTNYNNNINNMMKNLNPNKMSSLLNNNNSINNKNSYSNKNNFFPNNTNKYNNMNNNMNNTKNNNNSNCNFTHKMNNNNNSHSNYKDSSSQYINENVNNKFNTCNNKNSYHDFDLKNHTDNNYNNFNNKNDFLYFVHNNNFVNINNNKNNITSNNHTHLTCNNDLTNNNKNNMNTNTINSNTMYNYGKHTNNYNYNSNNNNNNFGCNFNNQIPYNKTNNNDFNRNERNNYCSIDMNGLSNERVFNIENRNNINNYSNTNNFNDRNDRFNGKFSFNNIDITNNDVNSNSINSSVIVSNNNNNMLNNNILTPQVKSNFTPNFHKNYEQEYDLSNINNIKGNSNKRFNFDNPKIYQMNNKNN